MKRVRMIGSGAQNPERLEGGGSALNEAGLPCAGCAAAQSCPDGREGHASRPPWPAGAIWAWPRTCRPSRQAAGAVRCRRRGFVCSWEAGRRDAEMCERGRAISPEKQECRARSSPPSQSFHDLLGARMDHARGNRLRPSCPLCAAGSGSQRASATLGVPWPRPPAARCPWDPDTLAGCTGVAWQQGRDWIGCARSRDRPGSGVTPGPRPGLGVGGSGAARRRPCPGSASAESRLGPWPPTRTARAPGLALPRAPRCRTRASCGTSSRGAAGRAGACGPPLRSSWSQPRAFPRPVTPASSPASFLVPPGPCLLLRPPTLHPWRPVRPPS